MQNAPRHWFALFLFSFPLKKQKSLVGVEWGGIYMLELGRLVVGVDQTSQPLIYTYMSPA